MPISDSEFHSWRLHPVTKELMKFLRELKKIRRNDLVSEALIMHKDNGKEAARMLGQIDALDIILDIKIEDMTDEDTPSGT